MSRATRRPLRYWGVDVAQESRGARVSVVVAIVLSAVAALTLMAVSGFVVELARGHIKNHMFWPAAVATALFAIWAVPRTIRAWRQVARARRTQR
jgi:hypothetical protein